MGITTSHARPHPHPHPHAVQHHILKSLPSKPPPTPSILTTIKYSISSSSTTTPRFHDEKIEIHTDVKSDDMDIHTDIKVDDQHIPIIPRCTRILSCGHTCAGVQNETINECFCLNEICVTKQQKIRQHASDNCGICLTSLSDDTCLALPTCGHVFHASCIKEMLTSSSPHTWMHPQITSQHTPEISRITFTHAVCAYCRDPTHLISHSTLYDIIHPIHELHKIISTLIHDRINMDALSQDERVTDVNSDWYQRVDALAWHIYAIYQCHQCNIPFFGGQVACEAGMNVEEMHLKRTCPSCTIDNHPLTGMGCHDRTHESDWVYKCRFCCNEALWVCGGDVHCCDSCHNNFYENLNGSAQGQAEKSKCPPEGKSHCPLNITAPHKNGSDPSCELVIRCTRCSFEPTGPLYTPPIQHIQSQIVVHSHNLMGPNTSLSYDGWMNGTDQTLSIGTRIPSLKRKQQHASQQHVQSSWQLQLITGSRYIQPSHLDEWRWEVKQPIVDLVPDPVLIPVPVPVEREIVARDCMHPCDMWYGGCCACEDEREFAPLDGMIKGTDISRYQYYCPPCKQRETARWEATRRVVQRQQQQYEIPQAPPLFVHIPDIDAPLLVQQQSHIHPYHMHVREQVLQQIRVGTRLNVPPYALVSQQQIAHIPVAASTSQSSSSLSPPSPQPRPQTSKLLPQHQHPKIRSMLYAAPRERMIPRQVNKSQLSLPRLKVKKVFKNKHLNAHDEKYQEQQVDGMEDIQWLNVAIDQIMTDVSVQDELKQDKYVEEKEFKEEQYSEEHKQQKHTQHALMEKQHTHVKPEQRPRSYSLPLSQSSPTHTRSHSHVDISFAPLEIDGIPIAPPLSPIQPRVPFHIRPQHIPIAPPLPMPVMEEKHQPEPEREHVRIRTLLPDTCTFQWQTSSGFKSYTIALRRSGEALGQHYQRPSRAKRMLNWLHHPKPGQKIDDTILQQWMDYEISPVIEVSEYVRVIKIQPDMSEDVSMSYLLRVDLLDAKKRLLHTREMRQIIHAHDEWDRIRLVLMFIPRGVRYIRVTHGVDPTSTSPSAHLQLTGTSVKLHTMASGDRLQAIAVVAPAPDQPPPFRRFRHENYLL